MPAKYNMKIRKFRIETVRDANRDEKKLYYIKRRAKLIYGKI